MRFVAAGPNLPDELLEARDAGNVVFFCGAGISRPAGLPGFFDLASQSITALGAAEGAPPRAASVFEGGSAASEDTASAAQVDLLYRRKLRDGAGD